MFKQGDNVLLDFTKYSHIRKFYSCKSMEGVVISTLKKYWDEFRLYENDYDHILKYFKEEFKITSSDKIYLVRMNLTKKHYDLKFPNECYLPYDIMSKI